VKEVVKFLHTADWHLGIKYAKLGLSAEKARGIRVRTVENLINLAKENNVDFVIIAGDLFDNNEVDRGLIEVVLNIIAPVAPIPVYILPGNHDPLTRDSLYLDSSWKALNNVVIFETKEPIEIPELNVTLYPCPVTQKQTRSDLTEWIKAMNESISIGIAHGNLQIEGFIDDSNFPIDPERVEKSGLDYLALGEWHSLFKYGGKDGIVRTVYPGTPETTKFGESASGKAGIVEIEEHGSKPVIHEIDIGTLRWEEWTKEVSTIEDIKHIERELAKIEEQEYRVINLYLKGVIDQETADYLDSFETLYSEEFLFFNLVKDELYLKPNLLKLKAMLPEGAIFGKTVETIVALMKYHPTRQEYSEMSPKEAEEILREVSGINSAVNASPETLEQALLLLYQMVKEGME
jgi:DNA repair exonuclease SbcCD nuclease subunit